MRNYAKVLALVLGLTGLSVPSEAFAQRPGPRGRPAVRPAPRARAARPAVAPRAPARPARFAAPRGPGAGWRAPVTRFRAAGPRGRPAWGRGWARLPGRAGPVTGWYGRSRWGRAYAPNFTGWAYTSYSPRYRVKVYYLADTQTWYYLSPRYAVYLPFSAYQEAEAGE